MGGDRAPGAILDGALLACERGLHPEQVLLVGDEDAMGSHLESVGGNPGFSIQHASEVIGMDEKPAAALRAKPDSSIGGCVKAIRGGEATGMVCMGNTGACVGAATLGLGTLDGVRRPGIAVVLEWAGKPMVFIDMGANVTPRADHLRQYGVMGAVYSRDCLGVKEPRVGLFNIGEEESKGTDVLKETHALLKESSLRFVGNVEGDGIFTDQADVVVLDGFTGNAILKTLEGFGAYLLKLVGHGLKSHGAEWAPELIQDLGKTLDYSEYGGALLLGVKGIVVIGHGRSDAGAVANALRVGVLAADADVNRHIVSGLGEHS